MDHSLGESQNYHRPTEEELLEDYLNVIDLLTINEENRLKKKVEELTEKQDEISYLKFKYETEIRGLEHQITDIREELSGIVATSRNKLK